jgi:hypothetical protein
MSNPIFPDQPALIRIYNLPAKADFISYSINSEYLTLRAWMPSGIGSFVARSSVNDALNQFHQDHCAGCERRTTSYFRETYPELFDDFGDYNEGDMNNFFDSGRDCSVWWNGYRGQQCPRGFESPSLEENAIGTTISNMVFDAKFSYKRKGVNKFDHVRDNAHLQAGKLVEENDKTVIYQTQALAAANVYCGDSDHYIYGPICWGANSYPTSLRGIAAKYFESRFNNDLLRLSAFTSHCAYIEDWKEKDEYSICKNHKFVCSGYDSMMFIDALHDVQAFFTMLMAGFKPIEESPNIMMVPMKTATIHKGDCMYMGYVTEPDAVGREWYVSTEGFLIGQLDPSFVTA